MREAKRSTVKFASIRPLSSCLSSISSAVGYDLKVPSAVGARNRMFSFSLLQIKKYHPKISPPPPHAPKKIDKNQQVWWFWLEKESVVTNNLQH